jgi:predicted NUDIX family phosphoesterase
MNTEKVLCISKADLPSLKSHEGVIPMSSDLTIEVKSDVERRLKEHRTSLYHPRHLVEDREDLVQLIPYAVIMNSHWEILQYIRGKSGGERRLDEKLSIGIGGHMNPLPDDALGILDFDRLIQYEIQREFEEETQNPMTIPCMTTPLGWIYSTSDDVGAVHLGYVSLILQPHLDRSKFSSEISAPSYQEIGWMFRVYNSLEGWSKYSLDAVYGLLNPIIPIRKARPVQSPEYVE